MPDGMPAQAGQGIMSAGPPNAPQAPPAAPQGATAPATVAPDSAGMKMRGMVKVTMMLKMADEAIGLLGSQTKEGQELMQAVIKLRKTFGNASGDLQRSEMKLMNERAPQVDSPNPQQGAAMAAKLKQQSMGMGSPAPAPA